MLPLSFGDSLKLIGVTTTSNLMKVGSTGFGKLFSQTLVPTEAVGDSPRINPRDEIPGQILTAEMAWLGESVVRYRSIFATNLNQIRFSLQNWD